MLQRICYSQRSFHVLNSLGHEVCGAGCHDGQIVFLDQSLHLHNGYALAWLRICQLTFEVSRHVANTDNLSLELLGYLLQLVHWPSGNGLLDKLGRMGEVLVESDIRVGAGDGGSSRCTLKAIDNESADTLIELAIILCPVTYFGAKSPFKASAASSMDANTLALS